MSADGNSILFTSSASNLFDNDTNNAADVFVYNRITKQVSRQSLASSGAQGNAWSTWGSISADGRFIAFNSEATNLASSDPHAETDVFVRDIYAGDTVPPVITIDLSGQQGENNWYTSDVTVTVTANDPSPGSGVAMTQYRTRLNDGEWTNWTDYTGPVTASAEGKTDFECTVMDFAGNSSTAASTIYIDKSAPQITFTVPDDGSTLS